MRNQCDNPHKLLSTVPDSVTVCCKCQEPLNPISLNLINSGELCVLDVVSPAVSPFPINFQLALHQPESYQEKGHYKPLLRFSCSQLPHEIHLEASPCVHSGPFAS